MLDVGVGQALAELAESDLSRALVCDGDHLLGIVSISDLWPTAQMSARRPREHRTRAPAAPVTAPNSTGL